MRSLWPLLAIALLLLAGCASSPEPTPVEPAAPTPGTLAPTTGWGQIPVPGGSVVRLHHPSFERLDWLADREGRHGAGMYTVAILHAANSTEPLAEFVWIGYEAGFSGPQSSNDGALRALGDDLRLTFATNLEGWKIDIGNGDEVAWELGDHPDLSFSVPEPTDEAGMDLTVGKAAHRQRWQSDPLASGTRAYAAFWTSHFSSVNPIPTIHAGVVQYGFGFTQQDPSVSLPLPSFGYGAYVGGSLYETTHLEGPDLRAVAILDTTEVRTGTHSTGMAVAAVPISPPAASAGQP